ncbi:MAG TPA: DUF1330 domain-containing protein [Candidatus Sulfotelmatobacter sp.]|nr:DUF1330 domain-containing protein [Candidatus Sulfotelmatobacter sp.]
MSPKAIDDLNIAEVGALPDEGPVVMVNLVRLRERSLDGKGSGWDAYKRYSAVVIKMIKARGGTVLWAGHRDTVALGRLYGHQWHYVVLIRYPSRAAFLDMMTSAEYAAANTHRINGAAEHVILATREAYSKLAG